VLQCALDSGSTGEVRLCKGKLSGEQFAVKIIKNNTMDKDKLKQFEEEINILANLNHPNIVQLQVWSCRSPPSSLRIERSLLTCVG